MYRPVFEPPCTFVCVSNVKRRYCCCETRERSDVRRLQLVVVVVKRNSLPTGTMSFASTLRCLPTPTVLLILSSTPASVPASDEVSISIVKNKVK